MRAEERKRRKRERRRSRKKRQKKIKEKRQMTEKAEKTEKKKKTQENGEMQNLWTILIVIFCVDFLGQFLFRDSCVCKQRREMKQRSKRT